MGKALAGIGIVLLVVVIAGVIYMITHLDRVVQRVIQNAGTEAVGTPVTVDDVDISLREGRGTITGLRIANPPGFSEQPAFSFAEITVDLAGVRHVERIYAGEPGIRIEVGESGTNLDALLRRMSEPRRGPKNGGPKSDGGESEYEERDEAPQEPVVLEIDLVEIEEARATLVTPDMEQPAELVVEALRFEQLNGTPEQLAVQLTKQLVTQVAAAAAVEILKAQATRAVENAAGKIGEKLKGLLKELQN